MKRKSRKEKPLWEELQFDIGESRFDIEDSSQFKMGEPKPEISDVVLNDMQQKCYDCYEAGLEKNPQCDSYQDLLATGSLEGRTICPHMEFIQSDLRHYAGTGNLLYEYHYPDILKKILGIELNRGEQDEEKDKV